MELVQPAVVVVVVAVVVVLVLVVVVVVLLVWVVAVAVVEVVLNALNPSGHSFVAFRSVQMIDTPSSE